MDESEKGIQTPAPPPEIHRLDPYGFKNLYPSKKPATVTQQLQKSIDFRRFELYDFHLRSVPWIHRRGFTRTSMYWKLF